MANLIDQMNTLKGLDDASLQAELQAPSGAAPPFLVATEIGRRKDMRQRYEGEMARRKPSTTVVEDLTSGPAPVAAPSMGGGGIGIAAAHPGAESAPRGFAEGGIVDAIDYNDIAQRYNERLSGLSSDKDRARALALLAAGAGIMGGGHTSTLSNIGAGISAGVGSYSEALKGIDSEELALMRGIADVGQLQHQEELAALDRDFRERQLTSQEERDAARLAFDKKPADVVAFEYRKTLSPEERAEYDRLNPPSSGSSLTTDLRIADKVDQIYADVQKQFPVPSYMVADPDPEKYQSEIAELQRKARAEAYTRIKAAYGQIVADQWAAGMGLEIGDLVLGAQTGAMVGQKDPADIGL